MERTTDVRYLCASLATAGLVLAAVACGTEASYDSSVRFAGASAEGQNQASPDFKEIAPGRYLVEGDMVVTEEQLPYVLQASAQGVRDGLSVGKWGSHWSTWDMSLLDGAIPFCVSDGESDGFGVYHGDIVNAMIESGKEWQDGTSLAFRYASNWDGDCANMTKGISVLYDGDIEFFGEAGQSGLGPINAWTPRQQIKLGPSTFARPVSGENIISIYSVVAHELGHALGFVHEHYRVSTECGEEPGEVEFDPLTPYDTASIMHYNFWQDAACPGDGGDIWLSKYDHRGARRAYGFPDTLQVAHSGKCLTALDDDRNTVSGVVQSTCDDDAIQQFKITAVAESSNPPSGSPTMRNSARKSRRRNARSRRNQQEATTSSPVYSVKLHVAGVQITSQASSRSNEPRSWPSVPIEYFKCLGTEDGSQVEGATVVVKPCTGASDQQWNISPVPSTANEWIRKRDNFRLQSPNTNLCVSVANAGEADGTKLVLQPCKSSGGDEQYVRYFGDPVANSGGNADSDVDPYPRRIPAMPNKAQRTAP